MVTRPKMQDLDKPWLFHIIWLYSKEPHKMKYRTRDPAVLFDAVYPLMTKYYFAKNSQYCKPKSDQRKQKWRDILATITKEEWNDAIEAEMERPATKKSSPHGVFLKKAAKSNEKKRGKRKRDHSSEKEFDNDEEEENPKHKRQRAHATTLAVCVPSTSTEKPTTKKKASIEEYPVVMKTKLGTWAEQSGFNLKTLRVQGDKKHDDTDLLDISREVGLDQKMLDKLGAQIKSAHKTAQLQAERDELKRKYEEEDAKLAARIQKASLGIDISEAPQSDGVEMTQFLEPANVTTSKVHTKPFVRAT